MGNRLNKQLVSCYLAEESGDDILKGVVVCEVGEAKGHGFYLGSKFLDQVVLIGNRKQIKVRVDHPEEGKSGKILSIVGQAYNFRVDGEKVRADIKLFDVPAKKIIQQLAKQASNLFGMSLDFIGKTGKKLKNGLDEVFCKDVDALDFVESPAATNALFAEKVDSQNEDENETDDSEQQKEKPNMNFSFDKDTLAALGLDEKADEKSIKAAILAACEAKKALAEKSDESDDKDGSDDKKEMAEGKEDDKKDDVEVKASAKKESIQLSEEKLAELVANQVAKQFTALLAKTGTKPKVSQSSEEIAADKKDDENFGFSKEEIAWAKKVGIPLNEWRATMNKAAEKTFKFSK